MDFKTYTCLVEDEMKISEDDFCYYLDTELMEAYYLSEKRNEMERKILRARKHALLSSTDGKFDDWDKIQKAKWLAKWEFRYMGGEKGRFAKRDKPLDWMTILKKMKKAKKMMKMKGDKIRQKAQFQLAKSKYKRRGPVKEINIVKKDAI